MMNPQKHVKRQRSVVLSVRFLSDKLKKCITAHVPNELPTASIATNEERIQDASNVP